MSTTVILLAAGQSKRFSGIKQLAQINGIPMIKHSIDTFYPENKLAEGISNIILVLGSNQDKIKALVADNINIYRANNWHLGMGHSLADTIINSRINTSHILIALADQVAINLDVVNKMLLTSTRHPSKIIAAKYSNQLGVPAIFPAQYFAQLEKLHGDKGARGIIQHNIQNVVSLDIPEAAYDIDTPEDLSSYTKLIK